MPLELMDAIGGANATEALPPARFLAQQDAVLVAAREDGGRSRI